LVAKLILPLSPTQKKIIFVNILKMNQIEKYISINQEVRFGKPCITKTRITVADILGWLASGMSYEEIMHDFPEIKYEHILAALAFSAKREQAIKTVVYAKAAD